MSISTVSTNLSSNSLDAITSTVLSIGGTNASSMNVGKFGSNVAMLGTASIVTSLSTPTIDTSAGLKLGTGTATVVTIGHGTATRCNNTLYIQDGATTSPTQYVEIISSGANNQLLLNGSAGTASQVLTSGGAAGTLSWATPASAPVYQKGTIATPSAASTTYTFPTAFVTTIPTVILTPDAGTGSTTIYTVSLAGVTLTGFTYLVSGAGLANLNWYAIQ